MSENKLFSFFQVASVFIQLTAAKPITIWLLRVFAENKECSSLIRFSWGITRLNVRTESK